MTRGHGVAGDDVAGAPARSRARSAARPEASGSAVDCRRPDAVRPRSGAGAPWWIAGLAVVLLPLVAGATGTLDAVRYKTKPADGNLWSARYHHGRMIRGECPAARCIAFTFDDGPDWQTTPRLLEVLDARDIRATFFVVGHRIAGDGEVARRNREVLRQAWRRGHLVGNHTFHHDSLDTLPAERLRQEIDQTADLIRDTVGERPWLLRPPFGALSAPEAVRAVYSRGYTPVFWGLDSRDWQVTAAEAVLANVRAELDRAPQGGVLLMHDTHPWSVAAFPLILEELDRRSAAFVARGEAPYRIVGLEDFYTPVGRTRR